MDIEKILTDQLFDDLVKSIFTEEPSDERAKVKVVQANPGIDATTEVATRDYVGESLEKTRDYVNERIEEYDRNRLFSDEDLLIFLKDKILEERERERKEFEARQNKMKKAIIDDFIKCDIKRVIFNDNATIVIWRDDTKTVVRCQEGETFDKEKGLALCIIKHKFGDIGYYNEIFKRLIKEDKED